MFKVQTIDEEKMWKDICRNLIKSLYNAEMILKKKKNTDHVQNSDEPRT